MSLLWVTKAEYIENYKLLLEFNNQKTGVVDLEDKLDKKIFEPLKNIKNFKLYKLNSWTIEWENGADFSPEFLYSLLQT